MTSPLPAITPETLEAAVDVAARAYAKGYGLDLDDLEASKDPGDTAADVAAWRANLVETAREIVEAAVPVLLSEHREQIAREIEAVSDFPGSVEWQRGVADAAKIARSSRLADSETPS